MNQKNVTFIQPSSVEEMLQNAVRVVLSDLGVSELFEVHFEHPAQEAHGDFATNIALQLFSKKELLVDSQLGEAKNPRQIAEKLATALLDKRADFPMIDTVQVAGPGFINFVLSSDWLLKQLQLVSEQGTTFGTSQWGSGKTWLIEHTSPNPNKAMHLGHLRNNVTGMAVANLLEAIGVTVVRDAVDNNRGIAIAKLMWGFLKFARKNDDTPISLEYWAAHPDEWQSPETANLRPDRFMDELYTKGAEDCKNNSESEAQVRQWVVDWEARDPDNWKLWELVLNYVYEGQNLTLARLGNKWDKVWHEHEHFQKGKDWVQLGLKKGVFRQLEDGAILTDLEKYGISDTIVQKADGTALYITQDLALTQQKKETFQAEKMFWVIGPEQSLAMQQLFAVCDQLGIGKRNDFTHLAYGYMSLKGQGKMSSRLGNVVYIDDVLDTAKEEVLAKMVNADLTEEEKQVTAEKLAIAAVKYSILRVGRMTDMQFDLSTSLALDGDSGPYLEYTHARCQSVLRQAGEFDNNSQDIFGYNPNAEEFSVLRWLYRYPEEVQRAALQFSPNLIALYLFELAQRFNYLYNQHSFLNAESDQSRVVRLTITAAVAQVLHNGLELLGIQTVDRM